jgi:hypothetical protein
MLGTTAFRTSQAIPRSAWKKAEATGAAALQVAASPRQGYNRRAKVTLLRCDTVSDFSLPARHAG